MVEDGEEILNLFSVLDEWNYLLKYTSMGNNPEVRPKVVSPTPEKKPSKVAKRPTDAATAKFRHLTPQGRQQCRPFSIPTRT